MLKDIKYIRYLGYDEKTNLYSYECKIIDSDFEWLGPEGGLGVGLDLGPGVAAGLVAVINCYKEKDLPIAPNVMKAASIFSKEYGNSIQQYLDWGKQYCSNWHLVEKDIDKYLILL